MDCLSKIMIHTCNKRQKYVYDYLIPSLLQQEIKKENIIVWHDYKRLGNFNSFIKSMKWIRDHFDAGMGTWHLQDDVCISKNFKKTIEENEAGIVCGFVCRRFNKMELDKCGVQPMTAAWYSFPCIRIPNSYCGEFVDWYWNQAVRDKRLRKFVDSGCHDDYLFRQFLLKKHFRQRVINLKPNIVEHIDWLIGGSQVNPDRTGDCRSFYWGEDDVVKILERQLGVGLFWTEYFHGGIG